MCWLNDIFLDIYWKLAGARDYKLYYNDCELLSVFYVHIEFNRMQNKILS